ncbi:MAG TPA: glycosyltransferase family 1 protein [Acidobacteriota bacterium]
MEDWKLIINRAPVRAQKSGVAYYVESLIQALRQSPVRKRVIYHDFGFDIAPALKTAAISLLGVDLYSHFKTGQYRRSLRRILSQGGNGRVIYHETNNVPAAEITVPYLTTLQDLSVFEFPQYHPDYRVRFFEENFHRTLQSRWIVVPSEATRRDLVRSFSVPAEMIRVVPHGRNPFYQPIDPDCARTMARRYTQRPFILYAGIIEPRKNLSNLILAFERVNKKRDLDLVMAGGYGWLCKDVLRLPARLGLKNVRFTGYVPEADLRALYNAAEIFVYPSLLEGFGLPPIEAMSCGLPSILSRTSSLPEVGADAALYVDPASVEEMAQAMLNLLDDIPLRETLRARGLERCRMFDWNRTASQMIDIYQELAAEC